MTTFSLISLLVILGLTFSTIGARRKRKFGCVLPQEPMFGHFDFKYHTRQIVYVCDKGYALNLAENTRKCKRNRKWTGKDGDCIKLYSSSRCKDPESPKNGEILSYELDNGDKEVRFYCNDGYRLDGSETLTCKKADGEWYGGTFPVCKSYKTAKDFANNLKEAFIDPLASATADSKDCDVCGKLSAGKSGLDIIFLLDVSSSIGTRSLNTSKEFLKLLVDKFQISSDPTGGKNGTRIALITFSSDAEIVFALNDENVRTVETAVNKIYEVKNKGGGTNLRAALRKATDIHLRFLKGEKERYASSTRAVFVLTDAEATFKTTNGTDMKLVKSYAERLKSSKFEIFTIGVGSNIDRATLELIASQPKQEHVFLLEQFKSLKRATEIIAETNIDYGQCGISGNFEVQAGDHETKLGAWPWLGWVGVTMTKNETIGRPALSQSCGGALLCDRWFLTLAHCVSFVDQDKKVLTSDPKLTNVILGDHKLYEPDNTQIIVPVKNVLIHPNYTGDVLFSDDSNNNKNDKRRIFFGVRKYDVALLDLWEENPPPLNKYIRPICFPTKGMKGKVDIWHVSEALLHRMLQSSDQAQKGYIAGWGHAPINNKIPFMMWNMQHQARRKILPVDKCLKRFPGLDTDHFFCVYDNFGESDYCRGDVGGPFMMEMSNSSRFTMLGLAARTHDCNEMSQHPFSIYQSLINREISGWIEEQLEGCNRFEEDENWAKNMKSKRDEYKEKKKEREDDEKKRADEKAREIQDELDKAALDKDSSDKSKDVSKNPKSEKKDKNGLNMNNPKNGKLNIPNKGKNKKPNKGKNLKSNRGKNINKPNRGNNMNKPNKRKNWNKPNKREMI